MGNRILKESICKSDQIDDLSWFEEVFFYRLLVNCDDYGVMDARPKILKADLFPLKDITLEAVTDALNKIVRVGLARAYEKDGKPYVQVIKWSEHQRIRDSKHKYPVADDCGELPQVAASCGEFPQTAEKSGSRVRPRAGAESESESESLSESLSLLSDDDAREIRNEQDQVLDAAENAGFQKTDAVRSKLIRLYADYGKQKMLDGIDSCVTHGAPNIAYLLAVLKGEPKARRPTKAYTNQRDYSGEQAEAMQRMIGLA